MNRSELMTHVDLAYSRLAQAVDLLNVIDGQDVPGGGDIHLAGMINDVQDMRSRLMNLHDELLSSRPKRRHAAGH